MVIFDEAHNVENVCSDSYSFDLTATQVGAWLGLGGAQERSPARCSAASHACLSYAELCAALCCTAPHWMNHRWLC